MKTTIKTKLAISKLSLGLSTILLFGMASSPLMAITHSYQAIKSVNLLELTPPWEEPRGTLKFADESATVKVSYDKREQEVRAKLGMSNNKPPTITYVTETKVETGKEHLLSRYPINPVVTYVPVVPVSELLKHYPIEPVVTYTPTGDNNTEVPASLEGIIKAANDNNMLAQYQLGLRYQNGDGVEKDMFLSNQWIIRSANNGYSEAQFIAFKRYLKAAKDRFNIKQALFYLKSAVEKHHPEAQYTLGKMFMDGIYVVKNKREGKRLLEEAASQGHVKSVSLLGKL